MSNHNASIKCLLIYRSAYLPLLVLLILFAIHLHPAFFNGMAPADRTNFLKIETAAAPKLFYTFNREGHVLGFGEGRVWVAGADHSLEMKLVHARHTEPLLQKMPERREIKAVNCGGTQPFNAILTYDQAWPGVSVIYRPEPGAIVESEYQVAAGFTEHTIEQIKIGYNRPVILDATGNLVFRYDQGILRETAPVAWQVKNGRKILVKAEYVRTGVREIGFRVRGTDARYPLIIDPSLTWSTFIGGSSDDEACDLALDASGNVFVAGRSWGAWGSPVRGYNGDVDGFIVKLNASGSLVWHTFLGGAGHDTVFAVVLDDTGNIYAGGFSNASWGTPVRSYTGMCDVFAAKLNATGVLQWNSFFGYLSYDDYGISMAVDGLGNLFVGGYTPINSTNSDSFALKFDSNGALKWNSYVGGVGKDEAYSLNLDGNGNVYLTGISNATWGTPNRLYSSNLDAFLVKIEDRGTSGILVWNTFLGGTGDDWGFGVITDSAGNIYAGGNSNQTWGVPVRTHRGGEDAFVAKLNNAGTLQWNTFLGGTGNDRCYGMAVDSQQRVYVGGFSSAGWGSPVRAHSGADDALAVKLESDGTLLWNTFLGGSGTDWAYDLLINASGKIFLTGVSNFTWGSPVRSYTGAVDGFAVNLDYTDLDPVTPTKTFTKTFTPTHTKTHTKTYTPIISPTSTITPSASVTASITRTNSPTPSITKTSTVTPTITPSPSITLTVTPTLTRTPTPTSTANWTATPTSTPTAYVIDQGEVLTYPSPARGRAVWFYFQTNAPAIAQIEVFNAIGEQVVLLTDRVPAAGYHTLPWKIQGSAPGVYIYRVRIEEGGRTRDLGLRKMMIVK